MAGAVAVVERDEVCTSNHDQQAAGHAEDEDCEACEHSNEPIKFADIGLECGEEPMRVESLCMNCRDNGTTTIFFTRIPHFREVVLMAFECPHCGFRNNEVQPASVIQEQGCRMTLTVRAGDTAALSRQVVKSETAVLSLPELEFEIPANTQKGILSTVEGMLTQAITNLQLLQEERRAADPATASALDAFCERLGSCARAEVPFTLVLDDPAGNSFIETKALLPPADHLPTASAAAVAVGHTDGAGAGPPSDVTSSSGAAADGQPQRHQGKGTSATGPAGESSASDPDLRVERYDRTAEMSAALGLAVEDPSASTRLPEIAEDDPYHGPRGQGAVAAHRAMARIEGAGADAFVGRYSAPEEVIVLPGSCYACGAEADTRMYQTSIPFFKEVIIMSNACDKCGYRNSEIKAGGAISERGREIRLRVETPEDLRRDVIKAESASICVPELDLDISTGSLGGLISTVEGLLARVKEELSKLHSFHLGDSAQGLDKQHWRSFFAELEVYMAGDKPWTLVLRDPLANSFVAPITDTVEDDPRLTSVEFERTEEEDEEYGIQHLRELDAREHAQAAGDASP